LNAPVSEMSAAPAGFEPTLATLGDISVTHHWVHVPAGRYPIQGTTWTVQDMSRTEEKISTTGIVLAVIFVWFCLLGLLFLLMKEQRQVGWVQINVQGAGLHHSTMIPASPVAFGQAHQFVNYCRQLSAG
jgi:hypothetical protein